MSDLTDLSAQASALKTTLEAQDAEIKTNEELLERLRAERLNTAKRLGAIERFHEAEGVNLPYSEKAGT